MSVYTQCLVHLHDPSFLNLQKIDHDCALVPRGALSVDAGKKVVSSQNYAGLSYDTSKELRAYMHMRRPENLQAIALLKRPGIIKTDDFLDCIDKDTPKGMITKCGLFSNHQLIFLDIL